MISLKRLKNYSVFNGFIFVYTLLYPHIPSDCPFIYIICCLCMCFFLISFYFVMVSKRSGIFRRGLRNVHNSLHICGFLAKIYLVIFFSFELFHFENVGNLFDLFLPLLCAQTYFLLVYPNMLWTANRIEHFQIIYIAIENYFTVVYV